jgi:hypothetical protein
MSLIRRESGQQALRPTFSSSTVRSVLYKTWNLKNRHSQNDVHRCKIVQILLSDEVTLLVVFDLVST